MCHFGYATQQKLIRHLSPSLSLCPYVLLSSCIQLTMQGCISRSINRYKNKPRSRFMLLFSSSFFNKKSMFRYLLLRSKSLLSLLNIREIFRCRFWRQSFFECIDGRLAMANVSLASIPFSFFGIPIATALSLKFSRTRTRILAHTHTHDRFSFSFGGQWKFSKRVEIFHLKTFNWCTTKTSNLNTTLKIHWKSVSHTLTHKLQKRATRSNNSLAIATENKSKMKS